MSVRFRICRLTIVMCLLAAGSTASCADMPSHPLRGGPQSGLDASTILLPTGDDSIPHAAALVEDWPGPAGAGGAAPSARRLGQPLRHMPRLSSGFGLRNDPLGPGRRMHAGIDLPDPAGSAVLSAAAGTVRFAGWAGGYGNLVVIDHGAGLRTRYGHLLQSTVSDGEYVGPAQVIGLVGATGHATGSHLHYEVRVNGRPVDPLRAPTAPGWSAGGADTDVEDFSAAPMDVAISAVRQIWSNPARDNSLPRPIIR